MDSRTTEPAMSDRDLELLRGTLDVLILRTLSWGPAHGYAVASWIEQVTGDALRIEEGSRSSGHCSLRARFAT
jgi:hypothetical protein